MNNKVLMSLVAASIAAMAAAPELVKAETLSNDNQDSKLLKLSESKTDNEALRADIQNQVDALLNKKTPIKRVSESISILVDNYGDVNGSIKDSIYKELNLAVSGQSDSSNIGPNTGGMSQPGDGNYQAYNVCHSACHGACHSACHGSRGWR